MAGLYTKGGSQAMHNDDDKYSGKMTDIGAKYSGQMHGHESAFVNSPAENNEPVFRDYKEFEAARNGNYYEERFDNLVESHGSTEQIASIALQKESDGNSNVSYLGGSYVNHQKYNDKVKKYREKLARVEEEQSSYQSKHSKPKVSRRLVEDTDRDSETGKEYSAFRIEKEIRDSNYKAPRGIAHKLNANISTDGIGIAVPVVHFGESRKVELTDHSRSYKRVELRRFSAPKAVQKTFGAANKAILGAESVLLKVDDTASTVLKGGSLAAKPVAFAARQKLIGAVYKAAAENDGMNMLVKSGETVNAISRAGRGLVNWSVQRKTFKQQKREFRYERKIDKLTTKLDKNMLKAAVAEDRLLNGCIREQVRNNIGDFTLTRSEKKKMWRKVFSASESNRNILEKPHSKALDTAHMTRGEIAQSEKIMRLQKREYRQAKKLYQKRTVKEAYVNAATGKKEKYRKTVIDTDRKKTVSKPKKPQSLLGMATMGGVSMVGRNALNKAYGEAMASDNIGAEVGAKVLRTGFSTVNAATSLSKSMKQHKQLSKQRKLERAETKLRKTQNRLQLEQAKDPNAKLSKKSTNKKKAQKKRQKATNAQKFRNNLRKARQKTEESVKKLILGNKTKLIALGACAAGVLVFLVPLMAVIMLAGGGGGNMVGGAAAATAYPTDNVTATQTAVDFFTSQGKFKEDKQKIVENLQKTYGREIDTSKKPPQLAKVQYNFTGFQCGDSLTFYQLAAFVSAYFRDDWEGAESFLFDVMNHFYKEDVEHIHSSLEVQIGADKDGNPIKGTITIDIYNIRYISSTDQSLIEYLTTLLSEMGEVDEKTNMTEYEKHYAALMDSKGGHQMLDMPVKDGFLQSNWLSAAQSYKYGVDRKYGGYCQKDRLAVDIGAGREVISGGNGKVKSVSSDVVTIFYDNGYTVDYYGNAADSKLKVGDSVEKGTLLFKTDDMGDYVISDGGEEAETVKHAALELRVWDKKSGAYINPLLVFFENDEAHKKADENNENYDITESEEG